jgi:hypothetical protein
VVVLMLAERSAVVSRYMARRRKTESSRRNFA